MFSRKSLENEDYSRSHLYRRLQKALDQLLDLYNSTCRQTGSYKAERLIKELRPFMLDNRKISFNPAYEIAFLTEEQQEKVVKAMEMVHSAPSLR